MRFSLFLAAITVWAGQGLQIGITGTPAVRTQNTSFPAMSHTAVICEAEISNLTGVTANDGMGELNAAGILVDYSNSTTLRFASNWITGGMSSNMTLQTASFANNYIFWRYQHDNAGAIGAAKTDYLEAWDINGVRQVSASNPYTGDNGTNLTGIFVGQNGNTTVQRVHFIRCGTNLVPIGSRSPATADIGPLNANTWAFHWKFDGTLVDSATGAYPATMADSSTPNNTCNVTVTSYCTTQFQVPIPVITLAQPTWRAGTGQTPSGAASFSQSDSSPGIYSYFWQILSGPTLLAWTSHTGVTPTLTQLVAGDYNLQLVVTDATPATAVTTQHVGVVATDVNDIVINTAGLPTAAQTNVILGPLQKWMSNLAPYPLFDQLHAVQWNLRSGPTGDFQSPLNGASSYQAGTAYFDYAQPGTLSITQTLNIATGSGTSWLSTIGDAGDATASAAIYDSLNAGIHSSDTFVVTGSNNTFVFTFDGGSPITCTLTTGSRNSSQIAGDIQGCIGTAVPSSPATTIPGTASGTHTVTPTSMVGIATGEVLKFNDGANIVNATVTGTTGSTFTATFPVTLANPAVVSWRVATTDSNGGLLIKILTSTVGSGGSIAVSSGSADALLGFTVGTFTVANNPQGNMAIIPWYLTSTLSPANPGYPTGRRQLNVLQVLSDTSLIVQQANGLGWRLPSQSGVQFAIDNQSWPSFYAADNNGNYYDNGLSDCAKAYKSGVATDIAQCRARTDRWFRGPKVDLGQEYTTSGDSTTVVGSGQGLISRSLGMMGVFLRALDGQSGYWTGLEYIAGQDIIKLSGAGSNIADIYTDQREFGYAVQRVSACALFDPGGYSATCRAELVSLTTAIITPSRNTADSAYPYWPVPYYTQASFVCVNNVCPGGGSVCVTNGSQTVTGSGTAFANFGNSHGATTMWFFPIAGTRPANNAAGDPVYYTPAYNSPTSVTLDRNYAGTTGCSKGYMLFDGNVDVPYIGWGAQPFMEGLMNTGFALASLATACISAGVPTNCDNPTSIALAGYVSDAATWIANVGYDPVTQGVFQGANYVNCTPPSANILCNSGNLPYGERVTGQEASGGISWGYRLSGTSALKTNIDAQFSAAWANIGGLPDYVPPSGNYTFTPGNLASFKYYGLMTGIDAQPSYQAVQLCAGGTFPCLSPLLPPNNATVRVTGCLAANSCTGAVANATQYVMVMTEPNGITATSTCSTPTCTVTANLVQGSRVTVQITYLSAGSAQLAQSDPFDIVVQ